MIDPITKRQCMTQAEAFATEKLLSPLWNGRCSFGPAVRAEQIGGDFASDDRGWIVALRATSSGAGNLHHFEVDRPVADADEAATVIRLASEKSSKRDQEAYNRMAAERASEAE